MKRLGIALSLLASPAFAQDFSEGSEAKSWNLFAEQKATFEAKVVDALCMLTGDCPTDCGAGKRQIGLLRTSDDVFVLAMKNAQRTFAGAAADLAPYCGQTVQVDGLLLEDPDLKAVNMYQVQLLRPEGSDEWVKINKFSKIWSAEFPEFAGKGPWFRRDQRINDIIAEEGYLGLGQETDTAFIKEWFAE